MFEKIFAGPLNDLDFKKLFLIEQWTVHTRKYSVKTGIETQSIAQIHFKKLFVHLINSSLRKKHEST